MLFIILMTMLLKIFIAFDAIKTKLPPTLLTHTFNNVSRNSELYVFNGSLTMTLLEFK